MCGQKAKCLQHLKIRDGLSLDAEHHAVLGPQAHSCGALHTPQYNIQRTFDRWHTRKKQRSCIGSGR